MIEPPVGGALGENKMRVIGFTADAAVYCPECAVKRYGPDRKERRDNEGNLVRPVFADDEWDSPQHCAVCGQFIRVRLTRDGLEYVREREPFVPEEWRRAYLETFNPRL
jgi:hypothetical protein